MSRLSIEPFRDEHLDAAGELLAARHGRHREAEPLLPERFEDPAAARAEVETLWRTDDTPGVVAIRDGRFVGYLVGIRKDDIWGANIWVDPAGHAVEQADDVRDLYAAAAADWVAAGRNAHYAVAPASAAELLDAWYRLGFGQQHAYGIRELPEVEWPAGVRQAEEADLEELLVFGPTLLEHQHRAPVFSDHGRLWNEEDERREILEDIARDDVATLVAEQDGRIVGSFFVCPLELSSSTHYGLARPERMSFLAFAATLPDVRRSGAGMRLTDASFAWARERGYEAMVADWRVTNLLASRFWTARGFRPTFFRLHRLIA
jgi:ribosomal protein S18 acetylase RimI-like enzyme